MYSGYLDRITENNQAVILVDSLQKQFHVPTSSLPAGATSGTWLQVSIQGEELFSIQIDAEKNQYMMKNVNDRMQRLKSSGTSRFKRQ